MIETGMRCSGINKMGQRKLVQISQELKHLSVDEIALIGFSINKPVNRITHL